MWLLRSNHLKRDLRLPNFSIFLNFHLNLLKETTEPVYINLKVTIENWLHIISKNVFSVPEHFSPAFYDIITFVNSQRYINSRGNCVLKNRLKYSFERFLVYKNKSLRFGMTNSINKYSRFKIPYTHNLILTFYNH